MCPYCGTDLVGFAWKYWAGKGNEKFELICPDCGNNVVVVARLSFNITRHGVTMDIDIENLMEFWDLYSESMVERTLVFKEFWEALFNSKPYGGD